MRPFSLDRWKPRHLLAAWGVYWTGLAAATLGPAAAHVWRVTQGPDGTGRVTAGLDAGFLTLDVVERGATVYTGVVSATSVLVAIALPPLALFAAWLLSRPRRVHQAVAPGGRDAALPPGAWDPAAPPRPAPAPVERERAD